MSDDTEFLRERAQEMRRQLATIRDIVADEIERMGMAPGELSAEAEVSCVVQALRSVRDNEVPGLDRQLREAQRILASLGINPVSDDE